MPQPASNVFKPLSFRKYVTFWQQREGLPASPAGNSGKGPECSKNSVIQPKTHPETPRRYRETTFLPPFSCTAKKSHSIRMAFPLNPAQTVPCPKANIHGFCPAYHTGSSTHTRRKTARPANGSDFTPCFPARAGLHRLETQTHVIGHPCPVRSHQRRPTEFDHVLKKIRPVIHVE